MAKYCRKCKVTLPDNYTTCPHCNGQLIPIPDFLAPFITLYRNPLVLKLINSTIEQHRWGFTLSLTFYINRSMSISGVQLLLNNVISTEVNPRVLNVGVNSISITFRLPFPQTNMIPIRIYFSTGEYIDIKLGIVGYTTPQPVPFNNRPQPFTPSLPSIDQWDPKLWVGKNIGVYNIISVIGEGGTSYILKGVYENTSYAIKVLKLGSSNRGTTIVKGYYYDLQVEASNLIALSNSKYTVKIYAVNIDQNLIKEILKGNRELYLRDPPRLIMELMEGGTVMDLFNNPNVRYSSFWRKIVYSIIAESSLALDHIHKQGYVHLDIKPQNIFISKPLGKTGEEVYNRIRGMIRIGDLGSASRIGGSIKQLTVEYAPPDQLENAVSGKGADPSMDIFALGVVTYLLLTGKNDRPDMTLLNEGVDYYVKSEVGRALAKAKEAKYYLCKWGISIPMIEKEVFHVINNMLSCDPRSRPKASEVYSVFSRYI
ncbi:DUF973 family protein [Stygiolobus caldivivus]|uniref:Protein kinase domain-containing protein n=1 Tax=Stygiolobus caldivivus TaxID=2824673 RepID=A0A8D5ZK13_9CREN|nr:DUF973 family protein [Stygiolobus caldivivus]BCU70905.1 hypothetical protein KN1_22020 [Stygiolobus caldivivus]